jgi:hypothetical protein
VSKRHARGGRSASRPAPTFGLLVRERPAGTGEAYFRRADGHHGAVRKVSLNIGVPSVDVALSAAANDVALSTAANPYF